MHKALTIKLIKENQYNEIISRLDFGICSPGNPASLISQVCPEYWCSDSTEAFLSHPPTADHISKIIKEEDISYVVYAAMQYYNSKFTVYAWAPTNEKASQDTLYNYCKMDLPEFITFVQEIEKLLVMNQV